jgi:hypothetical protein
MLYRDARGLFSSRVASTCGGAAAPISSDRRALYMGRRQSRQWRAHQGSSAPDKYAELAALCAHAGSAVPCLHSLAEDAPGTNTAESSQLHKMSALEGRDWPKREAGWVDHLGEHNL